MIEVRNLSFAFPGGTFALRIPSLSTAGGTHAAIAGPSGSGKSTFLNLLAGLPVPDADPGTVDGQDTGAMTVAARRVFRLTRIGFVFRNFALIDCLSVEDNILSASRSHAALPITPALRTRARDLAAALGMADKLARLPGVPLAGRTTAGSNRAGASGAAASDPGRRGDRKP